MIITWVSYCEKKIQDFQFINFSEGIINTELYQPILRVYASHVIGSVGRHYCVVETLKFTLILGLYFIFPPTYNMKLLLFQLPRNAGVQIIHGTGAT